MKKPRKPSLKKLPKRPKASASLETWKKYEDRVNAVKKENQKAMSDFKKEEKRFEAAKKQRADIQRKTQGARPI